MVVELLRQFCLQEDPNLLCCRGVIIPVHRVVAMVQLLFFLGRLTVSLLVCPVGAVDAARLEHPNTAIENSTLALRASTPMFSVPAQLSSDPAPPDTLFLCVCLCSSATPLHWAAAKGHVFVVRLLMMQESDVNSRDAS